MRLDLRVSQQNWNQLRRHFQHSFRSKMAPETAALGALGLCKRSDRTEYLIARLFWPADGDLKIAEHGRVELSSTYVRRAHLYMRENKLAGLVVFHTHPMSDKHVSFSPFDDIEEPLLVNNLAELHPGTILVSLVVGKNSQYGRVWTTSAKWEPMQSLVVVGEGIWYIPLDGAPPAPPPRPEGIFDSALALTGAGALALLHDLKPAIIGGSGTGSITRELLTRAGCRFPLMIDDDIAEERNANRILHLTAADIARRTPKVEISRRATEELKMDFRLEAVQGNVMDRDILAKLRDADVIFGCVDKAYPRKLLSEFSFQYLRPYIDVGTEIGADAKGIVSLDARASYVAPGRFCLMCMGIVTPRQLWFESLGYEERERETKLGYCDDLVIKQPAVMDLNMRAASQGTILLRHLLQPFLLEPLPLSVTENLVTYTIRKIEMPRTPREDCRVCQKNRFFGYGDCGPTIGLDTASVQAIIGPQLRRFAEKA